MQIKEQLEKAGYSSGYNMLAATWMRAAQTHQSTQRRIAAFWHNVMQDKHLQSAAATSLDQMFLLEHGEVVVAKAVTPVVVEQENRRGQVADDTQMNFAPAKTPIIQGARPVAQRIAAIAATVSIFDTYKLEDGTPIGDIKMGSLPRIRAKYKRHAALLDMIDKYAVATDPFTSVRDAVPVSEIQKMIQSAAEISDNDA